MFKKNIVNSEHNEVVGKKTSTSVRIAGSANNNMIITGDGNNVAQGTNLPGDYTFSLGSLQIDYDSVGKNIEVEERGSKNDTIIVIKDIETGVQYTIAVQRTLL